jgi:proteasome lid subunit RPN8/RPN11
MGSDKKDQPKKKGFNPPDSSKTDLKVEERSTKKPVFCNFPGPGGVKVPLRVAMTKDAYADITSHAASSLDAEICGVLAGTQCEDDDGPFLKVSAAVRGEAAKKGSTHVTFTHETWDVIHKAMEKDHPKLDIVGWYHSHPGFGVEFSEMDIFIQKNFFKADTQVAFVVDPLGGQNAMCVDTKDGIKYIDKFWVDGREQKCQVPSRGKASTDQDGDEADEEGDAVGVSDARSMKELKKALEDVQARLAQVIEAVDEQRNWNYKTILFFGMLICTVVILWIGNTMWNSFSSKYQPPEVKGLTWTDPVMVDGKPVRFGVGVVQWDVPKELVADFEKMALEELAKKKAATQQAAKDAATQPAGSSEQGPTTAPH